MKKSIRLKYGNCKNIVYDIEGQMTRDTVSKNPNKLTLRFSPLDKSWTQPGKMLAELNNTGNGFEVKFSDGKSISLDYLQAEALELLFREDRIQNSTVFLSPLVKDIK